MSSLRIVGAGFGRTGTLSMKSALETLGFGPCHHMEEVMDREDQAAHWQTAVDGNDVDWSMALLGFKSCVDWPSATFWRELSGHFHEARVLLTVRSSDSWYNSISKTIFPLLDRGIENPPPGYMGDVIKMAHQLIFEHTFKGNITDPEHVKAVFEAHNQSVIDSLPADRLLVYNLGDGWEPLCDWLGVPVPASDFPCSNNQDEFWDNFGGGEKPTSL